MVDTIDAQPPLLHADDGHSDGRCRRVCRALKRRCAGAEVHPFDLERSLTPATTPQLGRALSRVATMDTPYSLRNEVLFFLKMGLPLSLSALLSWGLPSIVGMVFAGHTDNSAHLQAAVGYGRVWYNCTTMVPTVSMLQYVNTMLPSCIGAKRQDRIGSYMRRSLVMTILCMLPVYALQFVSGPILQSMGIPADIAAEVQTYNRIMVVTNMCQICAMHMEALVTNLGYAKSTTVVAFTGGSLNVLFSYVFIYRLGWGMVGNAVGGIFVELSRIVVLSIVIFASDIWRQMSRTDGPDASRTAESVREPLVSREDCKEFFSLVGPQLGTNLAGWVVFEFQMLALANIRGIPPHALAAGAAWVQLEGMLAASQQGWLTACSMRTVALLGKGDPGASKAYILFQMLAFAAVSVTNVLLFFWREDICRLMSNDADVQVWLGQVFWVLFIHTQTRICSISSSCLFIPVGMGRFQIFWTFASFYCVSSPIAGLVALTDLVTDSIAYKMLACVGLTSIAQVVQMLVFYMALCRMDWQQAAAIVSKRVSGEKQDGEGARRAEAGESSQAGAFILYENAAVAS